MSRIINWAIIHGVSPQALAELREILGVNEPEYSGGEPGKLSEARVQERCRLEASQAGGRLWRNNVGMLRDDNGVPVRYGLCNESKAMNQALKSSDLIGIKPVTITSDMVGHVIGQFQAREVKREGWKYTGKGREAAQMKFGELVIRLGGDFAFYNGDEK
jgi:hypothetical protein